MANDNMIPLKWDFTDIHAVETPEGRNVGMRVSSAQVRALPIFMTLATAKRMRAGLDVAIAELEGRAVDPNLAAQLRDALAQSPPAGEVRPGAAGRLHENDDCDLDGCFGLKRAARLFAAALDAERDAADRVATGQHIGASPRPDDW